MAKKFSHLVALLIAFMGIGGSALTASALADGTPTVSPIQFAQGTFDTSVSDQSFAQLRGSATLNGKLEVRAVMPHGLPQSERQRCKWADFAWSDWVTSNGSVVWAPAGHHGWTHACLVHGVWRQIGGGPGQWNCGNVVMPIGKALPRHAVKVKWSQIVVVTHFTFTVSVSVTAKASQQGSASASCSVGGASASSTFSATGYAVANASAKASASSRAQATAKATGTAVSILSKGQTSLFAQAKASVSVQISGKASALCQSVTPPPNQPPPPPPPFKCPAGTVETSPGVCHIPPLAVSATRIQEIFTDAKGVSICFTFTGDDINKVTMNGTNGTFLDGGNAYLKNAATNTWCDDTFEAPSDLPALVTPVPLPNDGPYPNNNAADHYDVVTAHATTSDGLTANGKDYVLIIPRPQPPL